MSRYIDVENIRTLFNEEYKKTLELIQQGETHLDNLAEGFKEASDIIMQLPTADVKEVVHGEWIKEDDGYTCSVCKMFHDGYYDNPRFDFAYMHDFCPICGSDMRGEHNDE